MASTFWAASYQSAGKTARAAAALAGVAIQSPVNYQHFVDNKKPEFLSKFPHGKIPALEQPDGFKLFEGMAISRYVAGLNPNAGLLGKNHEEAALIDQWMHFMDLEVDVDTGLCFQFVNGAIPYNKILHNTFIEHQRHGLKTLNDHLSTRTFFVGERITLADISIASQLRRAATVTFDAAARAEFSHLTRHLETIINQPQLKDIFEPIEFVEKVLRYIPPPKGKKGSKPDLVPGLEAEEKFEKKEADDEDQRHVLSEPSGLSRLRFNPEDWKRQYSNKGTRATSLEWFYKNFESRGLSVWRVDFKYNEERTQSSLSSNRLGSFLNRLEASRNYLFSSAGAYRSTIAGALILSGLDIQPVVEIAPDWRSYSYKQLDLSDDADKQFFEAALAWDL